MTISKAFSVGNKPNEFVSVLDFLGVKGDGVNDDTAGIQAAIDWVATQTNRPTLLFPVGKYLITSTLTITANSTSLVGLGRPSAGRGDDSSSVTRGATIRYTGTGTAMLIGIAPGVNGSFIENTKLENLRIEVDDDTNIALKIWHSIHGYFKDITIFGNKGSANTGLYIQGGVDNIYEQIDAVMLGQTPGASTAEYGVALQARLGYSNDTITTTIFRRCYFHYAYYGAQVDYHVDFEDCIFEACYRGVLGQSFMLGQFLRCWWEANTDLDIYFGDTNTQVDIVGGVMNSYSRQTFMSAGSGVKRLAINGTRFTSDHASPILFGASGNLTRPDGLGRCTISDIYVSPNTIMGGVNGSTYSTYPLVKRTDANIIPYRFVASSVTSPMTSSPTPRADGIAGGAYIMPDDGHIVALNLYYSGTISAGTYDITTNINGSPVTGFTYPNPGFLTTEPYFHTQDILLRPVSQGDALTMYFHADASFATAGGDFVIEVLVAHGRSLE